MCLDQSHVATRYLSGPNLWRLGLDVEDLGEELRGRNGGNAEKCCMKGNGPPGETVWPSAGQKELPVRLAISRCSQRPTNRTKETRDPRCQGCDKTIKWSSI